MHKIPETHKFTTVWRNHTRNWKL